MPSIIAGEGRSVSPKRNSRSVADAYTTDFLSENFLTPTMNQRRKVRVRFERSIPRCHFCLRLMSTFCNCHERHFQQSLIVGKHQASASRASKTFETRVVIENFYVRLNYCNYFSTFLLSLSGAFCIKKPLKR